MKATGKMFFINARGAKPNFCHLSKRMLLLALLAGYALMLCAQNDDIQPGDNIRFFDKDVRVVNGKEVDLGPLQFWLKKREGPRPFAHWKEIQVFQIKEKYAGLWYRCVVKTEAGIFQEMFIANLPAETVKYFETRKKLEAEIATLRPQVEAEEKQVREANAVTPIAGSGPAIEERPEVNLAFERWRQKRESLAKLETELSELRRSSLKLVSNLAMFSGKVYDRLPVWDCGWKKQPESGAR